MRQKIENLVTLQYGVGYLEDSVREYQQLLELLEEGYEIDDLDAMLMEKRADSSLKTALRFIEKARKAMGGHTDEK